MFFSLNWIALLRCLHYREEEFSYTYDWTWIAVLSVNLHIQVRMDVKLFVILQRALTIGNAATSKLEAMKKILLRFYKFGGYFCGLSKSLFPLVP